MNKVVDVTANADFTLDLKFNDGSLKRFDVKPYLDYEVFTELKDPNYFEQVRLALTLYSGHTTRTSVRTPCILRVLRFLFPSR